MNLENYVIKKTGYKILNVQGVAINSGQILPGESGVGETTFNLIEGAEVYVPVLNGMGWLSPGAPVIIGNKISCKFINTGTSQHSGGVYVWIFALALL